MDAVADAACAPPQVADEIAATPALVRDLGRQPYEPVWRSMQRFTDTRTDGTPDSSGLRPGRKSSSSA